MDYFNSFFMPYSHLYSGEKMLKITVVKTAYIATTTLIDALLDERASRENISVTGGSHGPKID